MAVKETIAPAHDTLGSAASRLGVPKSLLSKAKKAGGPGFQGSRVYLAQLIPWLIKWLYETGGLSESDQMDREMKAEKLKQIRFEGEQQRGLWNLKSEEDAWKRETAEKIKGILRAKLKNELPPKLEGLKAAEIAAKMDPVIAELIELFRG